MPDQPIQRDAAKVELKPCPFCGGEAQPALVQGGGIEWAQVECVERQCGAVGPTPATEAEAIDAWNQRDLRPDDALDGRLLSDPPQIPPFISVPAFEYRDEERAVINGCLYLRADFAALLYRPKEALRTVVERVADVIHRIAETAEDEGDRVYFASTNDPHALIGQARYLRAALNERNPKP